MASLIYDSFFDDVAHGNIICGTDTFKVMLTSSAYVEDKVAHTKRSDVTNEISGAGYSSGGTTSTVTVTKDTVNNQINVQFGGVSWSASTITARKAVIYKSTGVASADPLVCVIDFGSDVSSTSGTFSLAANTVRIQN
jgi:hypothetical protein